jgi:Cd2+/Zn2+-exporting ATPase
MVVDCAECGVQGYIAVADTVRKDASRAVAALKRNGVTKTVMLTGDNSATASIIGREVGVDEWRANLLPDEKVAAIDDLIRQYGRVAMVGDGINDAPALARATVGIAMGAAGSATALETADVALMGDSLSALPFAIKLGQQTVGIIKQNTAFALALKAAFLVLAVAGVATLWMAVFADVGASMIVILNGMRLLKARPVS